MKKIKTKKGLVSLVSNVDIQFLSDYKWHSDGHGYLNNRKLGKLHRVILKRMLNGEIPKNMQVDHVNRNRLDNRRENLRLCTQSENHANKLSKNKWGYKGVVQHRNKKQYSALIQKDGKKIHIGLYQTPKEAAIAYNVKAVELFGQFALLNKIIS